MMKVTVEARRKNMVELIGFKAWLLASGFEMRNRAYNPQLCTYYSGNGLVIDIHFAGTMNADWTVSVREKPPSILHNPIHYLENASPYDASVFLESYVVEREIMKMLPCV